MNFTYDGVKPAVAIKAGLDHIFAPGTVFEVRIPKTKYGTISGYFDDTAIAAALIAKENGKHGGIYVTVNPVLEALKSRNYNKFEFGSHTTTSDSEITRRKWFLVDLDPVRPAGISSTDAELQAAEHRVTDITDWLTSLGWPEPLVACSGNGYHIMWPTDDPNDEETRAIYECATKMLSAIFTDDRVNVDTTSWNAARVWKVYGTLSAKGSNTEERPHRIAKVTKRPAELLTLSRGLLNSLADALKNAKSEEFKDMAGEYITDMQKWLMDRGQTVTSGPRPLFGTEGKKWTIARCPFNTNHVNPVVGLANNRPIYRCLHHSCSAFRWKEFREKIDPTYLDYDTIFERAKEWCEGSSEEVDREFLETAGRLGKLVDKLINQLKKVAPRGRVLLLEEKLKAQRKQYLRDTIGENNEKGNIVGLVHRVQSMQSDGHLPTYWTASYDHRIRVGKIGDISCERYEERHELELLMKFHANGDIWVKQTHCSQLVKIIAAQTVVNPIKVMLKSYRWDGIKRLDTWLIDFLGTKDTAYTRAIGRKWLISAVARGMDPGCQADHVLILEGEQGIGKSRALRTIGGDFYVEFSGGLHGGGTIHKDAVAAILGKLIVELSELATVKRSADVESLKAMITTPVDEVRLSYERDSKSYPRTCVFGGTTNSINEGYIQDPSGARRFWPTIVGEVKPPQIDALQEVRDQLWAEAVDAYENGEDWWKVPKSETALEQMDRQITSSSSDPWYEKVRQSLLDPESYTNLCYHVLHDVRGVWTGKFLVRLGSPHIVLGIVLGVDLERQTAGDVVRLKKILREIGFEKRRPKKTWNGTTYAYDLTADTQPALIDAIMEAVPVPEFPGAG